HQDHDAGLGDGAVAGVAHQWRCDQMLRGTAALAMLDELAEWAAEPRDRDLALGMEGVEQFRPAALIAIESPGLDQLGASAFVFNAHGSVCRVMTAPRTPLPTPRLWGEVTEFASRPLDKRVSHSALIPAAVMTRRQRAISRSTRSRYCCGVDGIATLPASVSRVVTSGSASTWRTSWLRRSTMSEGVPGALTTP